MKSSSHCPFRQKIIFFLLLLSVALPATAEKLKVGTVDMRVLLDLVHDRKAIEAEERVELEEIEKSRDEQLEVIQALGNELKTLEQEVNDPSFSVEKRKEMAEEAQGKLGYLKLLENKLKEFLQTREGALREKITGLIIELRQKVMKTVYEYAATQDVDIVFDASGTTSLNAPFLLYVRSPVDLTDEVLKILNKDAPASPEKAPSE